MEPCSGAAFELAQAAPQSGRTTINGWEIEVTEGLPIVVARGGSATNYESAFNSGLLATQQGLDLLAFTSAKSLLTKRFADNHLTWWNGMTGTTLRITSHCLLGFSASATGTVTDAHGNVRKTLAPTHRWHESLRYLRLSQATDDLFDGYRNAYLALESILSTISPQRLDTTGRPTEREGAWLRRALSSAVALVDTYTVLPTPISDPASYLFDELYVNARSAMSHAKSGRSVLLPQNASERHSIVDRLQMLLGFCYELVRVHFGMTRRSSGATVHFFQQAFAHMYDNMTAAVSDDNSPLDTSDDVPNPRGGRLHGLKSGGGLDADRPYSASQLWTISVAALPPDLTICRAVGLKNGNATLTTVLEAPLSLGAINDLEVQLGVRGVNVDQPRIHYPH
jgi:hypothetical protein